jgi:hypothetical protein
MNDHQKVLLRPDRLRVVPARFSWCDQQLFRGGATAHTDPESLALYLFLLTVADSRGLSFYSDKSLSQWLHLDPLRMERARRRLLEADLIAYQKPDYQVLSLPQAHPPSQRVGQAASVGEILRRVLEGGAHD